MRSINCLTGGKNSDKGRGFPTCGEDYILWRNKKATGKKKKPRVKTSATIDVETSLTEVKRKPIEVGPSH